MAYEWHNAVPILLTLSQECGAPKDRIYQLEKRVTVERTRKETAWVCSGVIG